MAYAAAVRERYGPSWEFVGGRSAVSEGVCMPRLSMCLQVVHNWRLRVTVFLVGNGRRCEKLLEPKQTLEIHCSWFLATVISI